MNLLDVHRVIAAYLDDKSLEKLFFCGLFPSLLQIASDQHFWHSRVESLSKSRFSFRSEVDWRQTYRILRDQLQLQEPSFWNKEDNSLVSEILLSLNFNPLPSDMVSAGRHGSMNILRFLLDEGSIHPGLPCNEDTYSPLTKAVIHGQYEAVQLLLSDKRVDLTDYRMEEDMQGMVILSRACQAKEGNESGNYTRIVKLLLLDNRIDPAWDDSQCLVDASMYGDNSEIVRILLEDGRVDPSDAVNLPIRYACEEGRFNIVALLMEDKRVDPSADNNECIKLASQGGHEEVVSLLLTDPRVAF